MQVTPEMIRILRQVYRLTLSDMAALLDMPTVAVWRVEHGERPITANIIAKIKKEFELTPDKYARVLEIYSATGGHSLRRVRGLS
jgi:transcriptional regulator with XRE-family HTH domain